MTSPAPASTWATRTSGLTSTSGRHATPFAPLQPAAAASRRCQAARAQALSYDGRPPAPALGQRAFGASPPPGVGGRPHAGSIPLQPGLAPSQPLRSAVPPPQPMLAEQQAAAALAGQQQGAASSPGDQQVDEQELRRRQKISAANKGRVPWNKGRKHPPEVIARIKAATQAAMQRPDVRERLAKANERREPHTDAAKEKIRVKLLERANAAREEINRQAEVILRERLGGSDDPELRALADFPRALEVISGLAWQYFKKEWDEVSTRGWDEHPEFRERCISKLRKMAARGSDKAAPKKRKVDKVKAALGHMRKLEEARAKLGSAEEAVAKLRRAKVAFAGDPARLAAATAAEEKATQLLTKLKQQVEKLENALQPLEQYLEQPAAAAAQQQLPQQLEQRLEEAQQQQRDRVQQLSNGSAPAAAPAFANGAAPAGVNGLSNGTNGAVALNGATAGHQHAMNGHAPAVPAAAGPARATLPWQR
ncbi:hypothetical protein ABPG77_007334 [Micractinium sp. CCAP 211/92]